MSKEVEKPSDDDKGVASPERELLHHEKYCAALLGHKPLQEGPNVRCFYTTDNRVFLAILLMETNDSFLVGAGARLIMGADKRIMTESVGSEPVMRFLKANVIYTTHAQPRSLYHYYTYLMEGGRLDLPDYFTDEYINMIDGFIEKYEIQTRIAASERVEPNHSREEVAGATDGFTPHITSEKIH